MPLREIEIHIPFAGGVETKTDPKAVPTAKLLALENGIFRRAISIGKRNGYSALSSDIDGEPGRMIDAVRMASRGDELLAFSRSRCYSRGDDQWSDAGAVYSAPATERPLARTGTQQLVPDHATLGRVTVSAWEDSRGGVWWTTTDAVSNRIYRAAEMSDAAGISPRCVPCGGNLHIYYAIPSQQRIMVIVVDPRAPAGPGNKLILADDLSPTSPHYDACTTGTPTAEAMALWSSHPAGASVIAWFEAGTASIRFGFVTPGGAIGSPLNGFVSAMTYDAGATAASPIAIAYRFRPVSTGNDALVIAYTRGSSGVVTSWVAGPSIITNADAFDATMVSGDSTRVALCVSSISGHPPLTVGTVRMIWSAWERTEAVLSERSVDVCSVTLDEDFGVVEQTSDKIRSVCLVSRAFQIGDDVFAMFVHDTESFNTYATLRLNGIADDGIVSIGRHLPGEAAGSSARSHLSSAHASGSQISIAIPSRARLFAEGPNMFRETGVTLVSMDFESEASHQAQVLGRGLYMGGACLQHYDGRTWTEHGFHVGPDRIIATPGTGGTLEPSATYLYVVWYEWTDAQGEVHRGPTSTGTLVVTGASDNQVSIALPTYRITNKIGVHICVARSISNETGNTDQLFRVSSLDPSTAGHPNGYVPNDISSDSITFVDRMDDDTLRDQEELYTDGGVLSNDPAPLGATIAGGKSRLFATDPGDGNVIRVSQQIDDGYGVEWPPDLTVRVDPFGGDITGLAIQDDRVIVFKREAIFMFSGDGPLANGDATNSGFTTPQLIASDMGCIEPASIVLTPNGHMFKSAKGFQLLAGANIAREQHDAYGGITYVGSSVESYNQQRVRRATVMPDRTQVVFLTDSGKTLLYDYLFSQWSTFTNHEGLDAAVVGNAYHYLRVDGRVFRETIGEYSDAGARIRLRFETAWLHMQPQLQGFQKFFEMFLLGSRLGPHQLGISYRTDYTPQWSSPYWLDATGATSSSGWITGNNAATIGVDPITGTGYGDGGFGDGPFGGAADDVYQWRIDLYEKGQSIQFRIEDFEAAGLASASFELTELMLTGGIERNAPKPFTSARSA